MTDMSNLSHQGEHIHDLVVKASLGSYRAVGQAAVPSWGTSQTNGAPAPDLLLPGLRRIEEVETEDSFDVFDQARLEQLRRPGMELWVVVPLSRIGEAHHRLSGLADRIQPWWMEDDRITFGIPRVP